MAVDIAPFERLSYVHHEHRYVFSDGQDLEATSKRAEADADAFRRQHQDRTTDAARRFSDTIVRIVPANGSTPGYCYWSQANGSGFAQPFPSGATSIHSDECRRYIITAQSVPLPVLSCALETAVDEARTFALEHGCEFAEDFIHVIRESASITIGWNAEVS